MCDTVIARIKDEIKNEFTAEWKIAKMARLIDEDLPIENPLTGCWSVLVGVPAVRVLNK